MTGMSWGNGVSGGPTIVQPVDDALARASALPGSVDAWLSRLRMIPDEHRDFSIGARQAELEFNIGGDLSRELIARGLRYDGAEGEERFAAVDLQYLGVRLGCADAYVRAMRSWAAALAMAAAHERLEATLRCAVPAAPGTHVDVLTAPQLRWSGPLDERRIATEWRAVTRSRRPALDRSLAGLLEEIASLDFCWTPVTLQCDLAFVRQTRLADCAGAAELLVGECARRGVRARTAFGLLLAVPFSSTHNWAEIDVGDDEWVPVDPLLLGLLQRHELLDAATWPATRSPGGVLLRLAERELPLVTAGGEPLTATFLTKLRPAADQDEV